MKLQFLLSISFFKNWLNIQEQFLKMFCYIHPFKNLKKKIKSDMMNHGNQNVNFFQLPAADRITAYNPLKK